MKNRVEEVTLRREVPVVTGEPQEIVNKETLQSVTSGEEGKELRRRESKTL